MSDESIQATAENLRADFLNATSTHQRWKVLNRAIDWAVAASENADNYRQKGFVRHGERVICDAEGRTIRAGDIVTWGGEEEGWIVRAIKPDLNVVIVPLGDDWTLGEQIVAAEELLS